jgi:TolB-like protein/DNA-binding SARP family transcriptional activator
MERAREGAPALQMRLLGPLAIRRDGTALDFPPSRKVRALIAYLALAPRPPTRAHLCELLWDLPNDPRGELRWCLSRARAVLDEPGRPRVQADADTVHLDLDGVHVDALEVRAAIQHGIATLGVDRLRELCALFGDTAESDFLRGLEIERSAPYSAWLLAQRRSFRAAHAALIEHLVRALEPASDEAFARIGPWLALAPFDRHAHAALLDALARRGQLREGDEHLTATARAFEAEGQDWAPIGHAWRDAKLRAGSSGGAPAAPFGLGTAVATALAPTDVALADGVPPSSSSSPPALADARPAAPADSTPRRASLAVMPFTERARGATRRGGLADGLAYDVITRLAKLRSMFVIAPGTVFALEQRRVGAEEAGRALGVDYVVSGALRREAGRVSVAVQLCETRSARIVWADEFAAPAGDALTVLDRIGDRIVTTIAGQIEFAERNHAILKPPESLDAWEAHHRGLWHMYRFDRENNAQAQRFFETAVRLDPGFARPYAGLSFTHFQSAFLGWGEREHEVELAYRSASQGLMADEHDPSAHWALGRAQWLRGELDASLAELDTSVALSPNFAQAHYTLAFVHAQSGDPLLAIRASDHSRELSPYDPLLFGMLGSRAIALSRLGRHDEAAQWVVRAMARPNAHVRILGMGAYVLALAGRWDEARAVAVTLRQRAPGYRLADLLSAFRYADDTAAEIRAVAGRIGLG